MAAHPNKIIQQISNAKIAELHRAFEAVPVLSNREISRRCGVDFTTVKRHRIRWAEKTGGPTSAKRRIDEGVFLPRGMEYERLRAEIRSKWTAAETRMRDQYSSKQPIETRIVRCASIGGV